MKYTKHWELVPVYGGGGNKIHRDHPSATMNLEKYAMDGATPSLLRAMNFKQDHVAGWKMNFDKNRFEKCGFSTETIPQPGTRSKNGHSIEASESKFGEFTQLAKYGDEVQADISDVGIKQLIRMISRIESHQRFALAFYASDGTKPYGYTIHKGNVENVLEQLRDSMDDDGVIETISPDGEQRTSDSSMVYHLKMKKTITHWKMQRDPDDGHFKGPGMTTYPSHAAMVKATFGSHAGKVKAIGHSQKAGAFFPETLKPDLPQSFKDQFEKLQIYDSVLPDQKPCLWFALQEAGLSELQLQEVAGCIIGAKIPLKDMPLIQQAAGINIQIRMVQNGDKEAEQKGKKAKRRTEIHRYPKKSDEPYIKLCLCGSHYFVDVPMNITSYSLKNWSAVSHRENPHHYYSPHQRSADRTISSLEVVELLLENRDTFLDTITASDLALQTIQFDRKNIDFDDAEIPISNAHSYGNAKCDSEHQQKALFLKHTKHCIGKKCTTYENVFNCEKSYITVAFDFETNTSEDIEEAGRMNGGAHIAYLCATYCEELGSQKHKNAKQMLNYLQTHFAKSDKTLLLLAHNAGYDFCFLQEELENYKKMENGGQLVRAEGSYYGLKFEIHNTYRLIPEPLRRFGELFNLSVSKEIMPYDLYTTANIKKVLVPLEECLSHLKTKDDRFWFETNCVEWQCINKAREVNIINYSAEYCVNDVQVLYDGYMVFRKLIFDITEIDCDCMLTLPAIGHNYCIKEGVFDGVEQLAGILREYVQKSVCGGRTMVRNNKKCVYKGPMEDFDEVSMYVGAAVKIQGYLRGKAKNFSKEELADRSLLDARMQEVSGYHCKILIKSVGKKYSIPLLNRIEDGRRLFTNDMVGHHMYVDKTTLEDLVEFQQVEYEVVNGIYFNEGWNNTINRVQQGLFDARLKAKEDGNEPLSTVLKLLSNSIYGRTLLAPKDTNTTWVAVRSYKGTVINEDGQEEKEFEPTWDHYRHRHFENILEFSESRNGKMMRVKRKDATQSHSNYVHCGCAILSQSKRSMSEVMFLALDMFPGCIHITDTDSMHIPREMILPIADKFREVYGRELIGKNLQQFHVDFSLKNGVDENGKDIKCRDVHGVDGVFLGKKAYCDVLQGTDPITGEIVNGYHYRMKGVPQKSIAHYCKQHVIEIIDLYKQMFKGKAFTFDLLADSVSFEYMKDGTVRSRRKFLRTVKF